MMKKLTTVVIMMFTILMTSFVHAKGPSKAPELMHIAYVKNVGLSGYTFEKDGFDDTIFRGCIEGDGNYYICHVCRVDAHGLHRISGPKDQGFVEETYAEHLSAKYYRSKETTSGWKIAPYSVKRFNYKVWKMHYDKLTPEQNTYVEYARPQGKNYGPSIVNRPAWTYLSDDKRLKEAKSWCTNVPLLEQTGSP